MDVFELQNQLDDLLKNQEIDKAIEIAENELGSLPTTDFHKILGRDLLGNLHKLIEFLNEFDRNCDAFLSSKMGETVDTFMRINPETFAEERVHRITDWDTLEIKCIYCEINGFYINWDRWFIDLTAYSLYEGIGNLEWLDDGQIFGTEEGMTITGLEDLQQAYKGYHTQEKWKDEATGRAESICSYLVVLRLQQLFRQAYLTSKGKNYGWTELPLLVSGHDMTMIYNATSN